MGWTEFNITPAVDCDQFLADVIQPYLAGYHDIWSWHFFWEPEENWEPGLNIEEDNTVLRFRILTSPLNDGEPRQAMVERLRTAIHDKTVKDYYEGAHGKRGGTYDGEAQTYGDAAWEATYKLWEAASQLALKLAVCAHHGELELPRSYHWKRTAHLTANQLGLPDVRMSLEQGHRYLQVKRTILGEELCPADMRIMDQLDKYLYARETI